jgi:hypothetical protein
VLPEERQIIWGTFNVSDMHEAVIDEQFFNYVGFTSRQMRYKNRRGLDPQVKIFMDQEKVKISPAWNLPIPNEAAAYKSLAKYGKSEVRMSETMIKNMNKAWNWTEKQFYPYMGNSRILSLKEAVDRLDMSSSSGFPFNKSYTTKRELFENDPDIMDWLEEDWERLSEDPLWTTIASSSLKEELRPKEKIEENSQRTFTALAADATVQGNRLFVDQNEKMYEAHTVSASSIGMSPLKGNWDKLFRKLNVFKNGYALDESQYDSSLRQFLVWGCAQFRWKCFAPEFKTEENFRRVRTYYRNLVHTLILTPEGILVMKKLGMPSGCVNTVTDNTLILYTLLAFAWICNSPEEMNSYSAFEDNTAKALLGDDNTWTVSDYAHGFFNAVSVIETWKLVGIITTTDSMSPRLAEDLDFLSAHTVFIKEKAVPLYSRDKLMTSLLFSPQAHITPAVTLQRCTNLLQIGWTDLVFRKFCRALIAWLIQEYDEVLKDTPNWIVAKSGIFTDEAYFALFTNCKTYFVPTQGYQETQERSLTPDNEPSKPVMSTKAPTKTIKSRRARRPRARGPRKGTVMVIRTIVAERRRRPRRRRIGMGGKNTAVRNMQVDTSSKIMGGPVIRNLKRISKPEPFEGDELVASLNGSVAFATTRFTLNPGNPTTFPWFNKIASLYERYKFTSLEFYFQHDVSQFAAQGAQGLVLLSALYDAASADPTTKQQIEATDPRVICMPNENSILSLAPQGMHPVGEPKFVRGVSLPGATDIKTYDAGALYATTQGMAGATEVGELHVRYRGFLYDRILDSSAAAAPQNFTVSSFINNSAAWPAATTVAGTPLFAQVGVNGLGIVNNAGVFTPPAGNYLVDCTIAINAATVVTDLSIRMQKNGLNIVGGAAQTNMAAGAAFDDYILAIPPQFISANGTDTFTTVATATFTAGGPLINGAIRFVAI